MFTVNECMAETTYSYIYQFLYLESFAVLLLAFFNVRKLHVLAGCVFL